jgi:hypothetical protein
MTSSEPDPHPDRSALAESVHRASLQAGEAAYEDAGIQGLCAEGRWEAAVAAMRAADVDGVTRGAASADPHPSVIDPTGSSGT